MFTNNSQTEVKNKLIILYTVNSFQIPLTNSQLTDSIMKLDLMNYFELQQYISDLVESSMLEYSESDDVFYYLITESGKSSLEYFDGRIFDNVKKKISNMANQAKSKIERSREVFSDYTKNGEHDYTVTLKVQENDFTLINLEINLVSNKQAKLVCQNWQEHASKAYPEILNILLSNTTEDE